MNNKIQEKNTDLTSTTINNEIKGKDKYSHVYQKQIFDRTTNSVITFVVLSTPTFGKQDWISGSKLMDINSKIDNLPLDYSLKATFKGNNDGSKKSQEGKALHITLDGDDYRFDVYTQVFDRDWQSSHSHTIDKALFDAYVTVVQNNITVNESEKYGKSPNNFSLNLD